MTTPRDSIIQKSIFVLVLLFFLVFSAQLFAEQETTEGEDLFDMSLEELMEMEVTLSARRLQPIGRATGAMYVITAEDIRQSGAAQLPDILRMVPGVEVVHEKGYSFAIGVRGFAETSTPRTQILLDGRSLHEPFWGCEQLSLNPIFLENIERIEILRGAAGVGWGANAMNGVINIVTKKAADTQGGLGYAAFGNRALQQGYFRYGGTDGNLSWRATTGAFHNNGFGSDNGNTIRFFDGTTNYDIKDYYQGYTATGRADLQYSENTEISLSGGHILSTVGGWDHSSQHRPIEYMNLLWNRKLSDTSSVSVRWTESFFEERLYNYDLNGRKDMVDFQHSFVNGIHHFVWGADYTCDSFKTLELKGGYASLTRPKHFGNDEGNFFIQDEITLANNLWLTLGNRQHYNEITHHDWAGFAALIREIASGHFIRASISKSFRKPVLREVFHYGIDNSIDGSNLLLGNDDLLNERLISYELGYRGELSENFHLTIDGFINKHSNLIGIRSNNGTPDWNHTFDNVHDIKTYGVETAVDWMPRNWWLVRASHSYEHQTDERDLNFWQTGRLIVYPVPKHKVALTNRFYLDKSTSLNTMLFWSDTFSNAEYRPGNVWYHRINPYFRFDARLSKRFWNDKAEFAVGVMNLTDRSHYEGSSELSEVPRQFYAQFICRTK